jgi:hypothetical protein
LKISKKTNECHPATHYTVDYLHKYYFSGAAAAAAAVADATPGACGWYRGAVVKGVFQGYSTLAPYVLNI